MSRFKKFLLPAVAAVAALSLGAGMASAESILVTSSTPATSTYGANTSWNYTASLVGGTNDLTQIQKGDTLIFVDVAGLVQSDTTAANALLTDWTVSYPNTYSPMNTGTFFPADSAATPDVVFTYTGTNAIDYTSNYSFDVHIVSTLSIATGDLQYGANDHNLSKSAGHQTESNYGTNAGPTAVPLPAAAWGGLGLLGLLGVARKYRRANAC